MKEKNIKILGKTAFLNGTIGLDTPQEKELFDALKEIELAPLLLDDLYNHPEKLLQIKAQEVESLVIMTTATYMKELKELIRKFELLKVIPKNVVFIFENDALQFCYYIRNWRKAGHKVGGWYYRYDGFDDTNKFIIEDIIWI